MEALKKLEKVQTMLSFMHERGISSTDPESDRFIADLLLFMQKAEPCGAIGMEKKRHLILQHLAKISATTLEEACTYVTEEDCLSANDTMPSLHCERERDGSLVTANLDILAMVGLEAMQHANSTLEDFCRSYFMFHEMDVNKPHLIFKFLPVLSFTESYIYQLDFVNEKDISSLKEANNSKKYMCKEVCNNSYITSVKSVFSSNPFAPLHLLLECHGLLTDRIKRELEFGTEYWSLEKKLCYAVMHKTKVSMEDVLKAIHLKSFDYRVLNLLLYQMNGEQVNELHMEFLSISELLVEISDDLYDYEDDVIESSFNILRMFVSVYGASVAPSMLAKYIIEAEEKLKMLSKLLDPGLCSKYWRRCQEATEEGGKPSIHAFGTWNIPHVIVDEEAYRSKFQKSKSTSTSP